MLKGVKRMVIDGKEIIMIDYSDCKEPEIPRFFAHKIHGTSTKTSEIPLNISLFALQQNNCQNYHP